MVKAGSPSSPSVWRGSASPAKQSQTVGCHPPGASAQPERWFPSLHGEPLWLSGSPGWPFGPPAEPEHTDRELLIRFKEIIHYSLLFQFPELFGKYQCEQKNKNPSANLNFRCWINLTLSSVRSVIGNFILKDLLGIVFEFYQKQTENVMSHLRFLGSDIFSPLTLLPS